MRRLQFETLEDRRVCALVFGDGAANRELADDFPYVGWVDVTSSVLGFNNAFSGSGVLIDPHWVLTAAHVTRFTSNDPKSTYESFRVGFGRNYFSDPGETQIASALFLNPSYTDVAKGFDLALLYFERPFISIAPVNRFSGQIGLGDRSTISGFGRLQNLNDSTNAQVFTGNRFAGTNLVNSLTDPLRPGYIGTVVCSNTALARCQVSPQMGGRPGDSGGALIIENALAGITVRAVGDSEFALTQYSRLDNAWIDATIASKAKKWQNEASPLDVNADGSVTAFDALLIINFLNTNPGDPPAFQQPYLDVTGDDAITAIDALYVINALNQQVAGEGEANDVFFADDIELNRLTKLQSPSIRPRVSSASIGRLNRLQ